LAITPIVLSYSVWAAYKQKPQYRLPILPESPCSSLLFLGGNRAIMPDNVLWVRGVGIAQEAGMSRIRSLSVLSWVLLALAGIASPQQIHLPPAVSQSQSMSGVPVTSGDAVQRQQAMAANVQRQAEIRRDSEKMFELTQELNDYLQKGGDTTMSADAVKKAEQIEKLAKSVRSKMKQSF
jgi:hypothetical protein